MAAYEATGKQQYLYMARQIADLIIRKITAGNNWRLPEHFDENWQIDVGYDRDVFRPFGTTVGHWLEWSRLLLQLWELGGRKTEWLPGAARTLFQKATEEGWDQERGGFYFTLDWQGKRRDRDRYWWPCAEGIGAAAFLNAIDGDPLYEEWYRRIWNWTDTHLIDHERGGWHPQLSDDLQPITDPWFGKPDMYHSFQACLIPLLPTTGSVAHGLISKGLRMEMFGDLKGRNALVTGGARGIGREIAVALAEAGCNVVVHARSIGHEVTSFVEELALRHGIRAVAATADFLNADDVTSLFDRIDQAVSRLDTIVNDADFERPFLPLTCPLNAPWLAVLQVDLDTHLSGAAKKPPADRERRVVA